MVDELKVTPGRGGNRHPLSVKAFILEHLANNGEDYIASMHRAYMTELGVQACPQVLQVEVIRGAFH